MTLMIHIDGRSNGWMMMAMMIHTHVVMTAATATHAGIIIRTINMIITVIIMILLLLSILLDADFHDECDSVTEASQLDVTTR